jgi:NitT/TauT family transport system permease protein
MSSQPESDSDSDVDSEVGTQDEPASVDDTGHQAQSTFGRRFFGLRRDIPRWTSTLAALICLAIVTGLWWWATRGEAEERILGFTQLPSIAETWDYLPQMWDSDAPERHLVDNMLLSLKRVIIGFALALSVGIPLGIAAGCFSLVRSFLAPLILFGRNIPVAALTALVFALFGTGELEKVMFIFIACVAFITADTVDAINDVAERYVETALTLGASRLQVVMKVLVPLSMPAVFNSLRVLFGLAFGYIMLVEIVQESGGAGGLGFLLNIARRRSTPQIMVIIILAIPVVAWLIDLLLYLIQCALFQWKYAQQAERSVAWRAGRAVFRTFWRTQ